MTTWKSIGAVLTGFIVATILSMGVDTVLENTGVFPTMAEQQENGFNVLWMNELALFYRVLFTILGGYVTARLAPNRPLRHVIFLGIIGTVIAIIGNVAISMIPKTSKVLPLWFSIATILIAFPPAWLGGILAEKLRRTE